MIPHFSGLWTVSSQRAQIMHNIVSTCDYNRSIEKSGILNGEDTEIWELYGYYTWGVYIFT